jgi:cytosine/adenosine deaminase-related metal-dependent hydrolase
MAQRRHLLEPRLADATDRSAASDRLRIGISPHAPYSVERHGYETCLQAARDAGLPLSTHLGETMEEAEFLRNHTGPFRELWAMLGAWDDDVPTFDGSPVAFARDIGLLAYPRASLAHVNYCAGNDLAYLAAAQASVIFCPRTHAYFRHPPHGWQRMVEHGINVAIGTDRCASAPDLNLLDDLRLLHRGAPDVAPLSLWEMATSRAARAIGMSDDVGTLTAGKCADFVVFPVQGQKPLVELLENPIMPSEVWIEGKRGAFDGNEL